MGSNLFETLGMEQNEVVMCRFLADLLDPSGRHGTKYLESFLEEIVGLKNMKKEDACLESTCVMTEYLIDNGRRIDIMLQNPGFSVPIEAKINAGDQRSQCYDYRPYARNAPLVYLTKTGDPPSAWSRQPNEGSEEERRKKMLPKDKIKCISWKNICEWLERDPEPPEQLRQYTEAIRLFLPKHSEKPRADCGLVREVLEAFRWEMDREIAERYELEELKDSFRSLQKWENQGLSYCPGLNYRVHGADWKDGRQMWFRIEVADDGYLSAGFCLVDAKGNKANARTVDLAELNQLLDCHIVSRDDWWFVWRFSNGKQDVSRNDVPNFKTMNRCAADLKDNPEKQAKFAEKTIRIFKAQLLGYLKPSYERSRD